VLNNRFIEHVSEFFVGSVGIQELQARVRSMTRDERMAILIRFRFGQGDLHVKNSLIWLIAILGASFI